MTAKRFLMVLAAMLSVLVLAAACGGDDDDSAEPGITVADEGGDPTDSGSDDERDGDDSGDDDTASDDDATDDDSGDSSDDSDDDGEFDVCDLLTDDEVSEALDAEMTHESSPGSCDWEATALEDIKFLTVDIILNDAEDSRDTLEATALVFGDDSVEEVDGVGDHAVISDEIGLEILIDDDYLRIDIYGTDLGDELEIETALAELALDRMP